VTTQRIFRTKNDLIQEMDKVKWVDLENSTACIEAGASGLIPEFFTNSCLWKFWFHLLL
jgi:hypothetical protein